MEKQRIDKFLSNQLGISRNTVRTGIRRGAAAANGKTVRDGGFTVDPENDKIEYEGKEVRYKRFIYIMMNKPAGVLSASRDKTRKTVLDLIPENLYRRGLSPVGRLDKDTTGLIIITDDGEFAHKCISPKSNIEKNYIVTLDGEIGADMAEHFAKGVVLADGYRCKPAKLVPLGKCRARVIITEGKYHQIKRMFGVFGLGVNRLHRESVGGLKLPDGLREGECAEVVEIEEMIRF